MPAPTRYLNDTLIYTGSSGSVEPYVMALRSGRVEVLSTAGPSNPTILTSPISPSGTSTSASYIADSGSGALERAPASVQLADGRFVTVWTQEANPANADGRDVWVRIAYQNSVSQGSFTNNASTFLVAGGADNQLHPAVAAGQNGRFAVAWTDLNGTDTIKLQTFNQNGTTSGSLQTVNTSGAAYATSATTQNYDAVSIIGLADGRYVVGWTNTDLSGHVRIFNGSGTPASAQLDIPGTGFEAWPNLVAMPDGRFAAGYRGDGTSRFTIFNADGTVAVSDVTMGTTLGGFGAGVDGVALPDGRLVFTWADMSSEIVSRIYFADGTPDGAQFAVAQVTTGDQSRPSVDVLADGRLLYAWETTENGTADNKFAIFDPREAAVVIIGSSDDDNLLGTGFNDEFYTGAGNDEVHGGAGNDYFRGGDGRDVLYGEAGTDLLYGDQQADTLYGGDGADFLYGGLGDDNMSGGNDADSLYGDAGNDILQGDDGADVLIGGDGHDLIYGGLGLDSIDGGAGNDTIYVGQDGNGGYARGGSGNDAIIGSDDNNRLDGDEGDDSIDGQGGADTIYAGDGNDYVQGGSGGDVLIGGAGMDDLRGGDDDDSIDGGADNDTLRGDAGNDLLQGGDGADLLIGGAGADIMIGGTGADRFQFTIGSGSDGINDFADNIDKIDISTYAGATFANTAITQVGASTLVTFVNGDNVTLLNFTAANLTAFDFIV